MPNYIEQTRSEVDRIEAEIISKPGQKRTREKTERMLEVGERMLAELGYEGLNVEALCREAGSPKMSFYNRFGTKARFLAAIQARFVRRALDDIEQFRRVVRRESMTLEQLVAFFVAAFFHIQRADRGLLHVFFSHMGQAPEVLRVMTLMNQVGKENLVWLLEGREDEIRHPDPDLAIRFAADIALNCALQFVMHDVGPLHLDDPRLEPTVTGAMTAWLTREP